MSHRNLPSSAHTDALDPFGMDSRQLSTHHAELTRPRSRRACDECRKRKRKCDSELPCSTCTRYEYTCRYEHGRSHRGTRAAHTTSQMTPREHPTSTPEHVSTNTPVPTGGLEQRASFLEREKGRFLSHASSITQARSLGLGLELPDPPRLHSFGYHTGIRKEPESSLSIRLPHLLSWDQASSCIDMFTSVIHPIFGFMKMESIFERAQRHWQGRLEGHPFEAVITGVVALGSLFSNYLDQEKELEIVLHAKTLLDDPVISRRPSQDLVMAWILRTIYSRATGRPNVAWLQSTTTLHLIEITGIHYDEAPVASSVEGISTSTRDDSDIRARITLVAQSLHIMIAYDFGKSIIYLDPAVYHHIRPRQGDFTLQLSELTNKVPTLAAHADPMINQAQLLQAMEHLMAAAVDHDFLLLARAELCFAIHRRLNILGLGLTRQQTKLIVEAGTAALPAARRLSAQLYPWWNVTNVLFQFVCVCLSIGTTETLAHIQPTLETFRSVIQHFNTHLTQEAFNTLILLTGACQGEKEKQVKLLQLAKGMRLGTDTSFQGQGDLAMIDPQGTSLFEFYHESSFVDLQTIFNI
ncbi:uncharacterized protein N7479_009334 [Penicillium vulpinum]|uniref:Zn(2)-C6 fungal-type domain-containing protein n=1 Tax=Penicillium vulpinum TaxID=29845 RepID=A0A1V6RU81_9EURO|nr:uncharacterized protein N7479_009334 [Penicillium vulpinum]KAJ5950921.1 hypothetical protein N7479_009334 [Penicillium vulpinum]OQE05327.1 hypothetical protein PENVUL_c025G06945 [Penicillium vulpinum]